MTVAPTKERAAFIATYAVLLARLESDREALDELRLADVLRHVNRAKDRAALSQELLLVLRALGCRHDSVECHTPIIATPRD